MIRIDVTSKNKIKSERISEKTKCSICNGPKLLEYQRISEKVECPYCNREYEVISFDELNQNGGVKKCIEKVCEYLDYLAGMTTDYAYKNFLQEKIQEIRSKKFDEGYF